MNWCPKFSPKKMNNNMKMLNNAKFNPKEAFKNNYGFQRKNDRIQGTPVDYQKNQMLNNNPKGLLIPGKIKNIPNKMKKNQAPQSNMSQQNDNSGQKNIFEQAKFNQKMKKPMQDDSMKMDIVPEESNDNNDNNANKENKENANMQENQFFINEGGDLAPNENEIQLNDIDDLYDLRRKIFYSLFYLF